MATRKSGSDIAASTICVRIGLKIRELRDRKNWSQRMLADHADIEQAHLARIELGQVEPGVIVLEKIARALEVPVWELLKA
jgi:transcriptional regulator with XRE-family HTH domain